MGLVILGVDPGFAGQGIAALHQTTPTSTPTVIYAAAIKTEKRANKRRKDLRVSADDQRRFKELWESLETAHGFIVGKGHRINALCIEVYQPYKEATGVAAKTGAAYGGASFWGYGKGLIIIPAVPQDIKRGVCGKLKASKKDVQDRIVELVPMLKRYLEKINKTEREHMADAAAHAYIGFKELWELRQLVDDGTQEQMRAF